MLILFSRALVGAVALGALAFGVQAPPSPSASAGHVHQVCWERSVETLTARKDDIAGFAVASDERIEAYLLYVKGTERLSHSARSSRTVAPV